MGDLLIEDSLIGPICMDTFLEFSKTLKRIASGFVYNYP